MVLYGTGISNMKLLAECIKIIILIETSPDMVN